MYISATFSLYMADKTEILSGTGESGLALNKLSELGFICFVLMDQELQIQCNAIISAYEREVTVSASVLLFSSLVE